MIPEAAIAMLGLRPHRRDALASSSAASPPTPSPTATTTPGQARHHRRRRLAARQGRSAQAERRCRAGQVADRREVHRLQPLQPPVTMKPGRDLWWHELMADASADCPAEPLDSEHPLFILYTSGSTGKPKGVLHTTAGYLLGTSLTHKWVFDLQRRRHLLVHRRHRLGHGPQLHRLWPALPTAPPS